MEDVSGSAEQLKLKVCNLIFPSRQATSGATKMVKSKSMEVMKAVTEDVSEVKDTLGQYTIPLGQAVAPIKKTGGLIKNTINV